MGPPAGRRAAEEHDAALALGLLLALILALLAPGEAGAWIKGGH
jgi:hypothetical protein